MVAQDVHIPLRDKNHEMLLIPWTDKTRKVSAVEDGLPLTVDVWCTGVLAGIGGVMIILHTYFQYRFGNYNKPNGLRPDTRRSREIAHNRNKGSSSAMVHVTVVFGDERGAKCFHPSLRQMLARNMSVVINEAIGSHAGRSLPRSGYELMESIIEKQLEACLPFPGILNEAGTPWQSSS